MNRKTDFIVICYLLTPTGSRSESEAVRWIKSFQSKVLSVNLILKTLQSFLSNLWPRKNFNLVNVLFSRFLSELLFYLFYIIRCRLWTRNTKWVLVSNTERKHNFCLFTKKLHRAPLIFQKFPWVTLVALMTSPSGTLTENVFFLFNLLMKQLKCLSVMSSVRHETRVIMCLSS